MGARFLSGLFLLAVKYDTAIVPFSVSRIELRRDLVFAVSPESWAKREENATHVA